MKLFNLPRGGGKTMRMLYASEYHNAPILCTTCKHKQYIVDMAKRQNINIPEPITLSDIVNNRTTNINDILVDDMDYVLSQLLSHIDLNMIGGTITIDREVSNGQERKSINI